MDGNAVPAGRRIYVGDERDRRRSTKPGLATRWWNVSIAVISKVRGVRAGRKGHGAAGEPWSDTGFKPGHNSTIV